MQKNKLCYLFGGETCEPIKVFLNFQSQSGCCSERYLCQINRNDYDYIGREENIGEGINAVRPDIVLRKKGEIKYIFVIRDTHPVDETIDHKLIQNRYDGDFRVFEILSDFSITRKKITGCGHWLKIVVEREIK